MILTEQELAARLNNGESLASVAKWFLQTREEKLPPALRIFEVPVSKDRDKWNRWYENREKWKQEHGWTAFETWFESDIGALLPG